MLSSEKAPSKVETVNDSDSSIFNLFWDHLSDTNRNSFWKIYIVTDNFIESVCCQF